MRRWARHVSLMVEKRSANSVLVENAEGKRLLGRSRYRWDDYNKLGLHEI
jgi:hypothetical protein